MAQKPHNHVVETIKYHCVPGPLTFQRATLKSWEWPGDDASISPSYLNRVVTMQWEGMKQ